MKHMSWRIVILTLLLVGAVFGVVACNGGNAGGGEGTQPPVDVGALIAGDAGSVYSIVYPVNYFLCFGKNYSVRRNMIGLLVDNVTVNAQGHVADAFLVHTFKTVRKICFGFEVGKQN